MEQYIGIDLHKAFFQVAAMRADGARVWEERFPHTREGIAACLARCGPTSRIAVEASGPTWTFADQLVGAVGDVVIVDARKTRFKAGYAAKTDRWDARRVADALRRDSVVGVYDPPLVIRQLRELCRYRAGLVRMRTACKQRLHAVLLRHGVPPPRASDLFGRAGQRWLATLTLPGYAGQSLAGQRHWLGALTDEVRAVTAEVERVATTDPIVQALDGIIGIGPVLALMIRAEIGVIERFPMRRIWPAMRGWSRASSRPARAATTAGLPGTARRGCGGRWWRRRFTGRAGAMISAAGPRGSRCRKAGCKPGSPSRTGSVGRSFASGRARRDLSPRRSSRHFMTSAGGRSVNDDRRGRT